MIECIPQVALTIREALKVAAEEAEIETDTETGTASSMELLRQSSQGLGGTGGAVRRCISVKSHTCDPPGKHAVWIWNPNY